MKPSAGVAAATSSGGQLEGEWEGSLEAFESGDNSALVVVFVSVAWWLGAESTEGCGIAEAAVVGGSESSPDSAGFEVLSSSPSSFTSSSSSSLAPAAALPHSLSFSEGGQVEVGVGVQESPSSLAASSLAPEEPSAPRGFRWILWWRTRLCFRVKVLSQV